MLMMSVMVGSLKLELGKAGVGFLACALEGLEQGVLEAAHLHNVSVGAFGHDLDEQGMDGFVLAFDEQQVFIRSRRLAVADQAVDDGTVGSGYCAEFHLLVPFSQ